MLPFSRLLNFMWVLFTIYSGMFSQLIHPAGYGLVLSRYLRVILQQLSSRVMLPFRSLLLSQIFSGLRKAWARRNSWRASVISCCSAGSAALAGTSLRTSSSCLSWTRSSTSSSRCASSSTLASWRWNKTAWMTRWRLRSNTATMWVLLARISLSVLKK